MGGQSDSRNDQVIGSRGCGSSTVRQLARKHDSTMYSNDLMHDLFNVMMLGIFSQHQSLCPTISWSEVLEGDKPGSVCPCAYPGILLSGDRGDMTCFWQDDFGCVHCLVILCFSIFLCRGCSCSVVSTSASGCLERLVSKMTCSMLIERLNHVHSLTLTGWVFSVQ